MNISTKTRDDYLIVYFKGDLDMHTGPQLKERITELMDSKNLSHLVIDLQDVDFIDSTGIGVLLGRYRNISSQGGEMALVNLQPGVKRVLKLAGLTKLVSIYDNKKEIFKKKLGSDHSAQ